MTADCQLMNLCYSFFLKVTIQGHLATFKLLFENMKQLIKDGKRGTIECTEINNTIRKMPK